MTDDDHSFKQEWLNDIGDEKVVCIEHASHIRRHPVNMSRLSTRFFYNRPKCQWALPVYNYINKINKYKYLNQTTRINIACIGTQNMVYSGEFLQQLFYNFDSIDFHVINRKIYKTYENFPNIKTYENLPTQQMMELLKKTHYILCFEMPNKLNAVADSMSASIPLAFSSGCQLIIPKSWQNYYNLNSVISYEDTLLQKNKSTTKMFLDGQINLNKIYDEQYELINHKNKTFNDILQTKLGKININFNCNQTKSIFSIIKEELISSNPNVVIDFTDNYDIIKILPNYFREINCFINGIEGGNQMFYHSDKNYFLDDKVLKINEPCFFIINFNSNYKQYLNKISKRGYLDVILIINTDSNIQEEISQEIKEDIRLYYKKINYLYTINNNFIIIPQK